MAVAPIAAIVLAAGASSRMGADRNKLLEVVDGKPMVAWPVDALCEAGVDRILVVLGHEAERVRSVLGQDVGFLHHEGWQEGMGSSIAAAVGPLAKAEVACVLVCVGDLPRLRAAAVSRLVEAFAADPLPERILVPVFEGREGHPVLFGRAHLPALASLSGDRGGRSILESHRSSVVRVPCPDDGILLDVDTRAELDAIR